MQAMTATADGAVVLLARLAVTSQLVVAWLAALAIADHAAQAPPPDMVPAMVHAVSKLPMSSNGNDGAYIKCLPPGIYSVQFSAEGYTSEWFVRGKQRGMVQPEAQQTLERIDGSLYRDGVMIGVYVPDEAGNPIGGAGQCGALLRRVGEGLCEGDTRPGGHTAG